MNKEKRDPRLSQSKATRFEGSIVGGFIQQTKSKNLNLMDVDQWFRNQGIPSIPKLEKVKPNRTSSIERYQAQAQSHHRY